MLLSSIEIKNKGFGSSIRHSRNLCLLFLGGLIISGCDLSQRVELAKGVPQQETALQPASETFGALMESGQESRTAKRYADAAKLFRSATKVEDGTVTAWVALGETLSEGGAPKEAAEAFREALKRKPQDIEALRGLGNNLVVLGQADLAIAFYKQILELRPQDPRAYVGLGVSYDMVGQFGKAQDIYERGLAAVPGNPDIMANKGLSHALVGDYEAAIRTGRVAYAMGQNAYIYRTMLALIYGISGDFDEARQLSIQDFDNASLERNINYFRSLHGIKDPLKRVRLLKAFYKGQG